MTPQVTVVSLGPGNPSFFNEITADTLLRSSCLVLRTSRHPVSQWLEERCIPYQSADDLYESQEDFETLASAIAERLWNLTAESGEVVFAVPDVSTDRAVDAVFQRRPSSGHVKIVPGFSYSDYYLSLCRSIFTVTNIHLCTAYSLDGAEYNPSDPFLITELNDEITAGNVKLFLSGWMDDDEKVYVLEWEKEPRAVPLYEIDRQPSYSHLTALAIPGRNYTDRKRKTFRDLLDIMELLRSPAGCPWDRKQTHSSLRPYMIEEAWESVDAIDSGDPDHLAEELGDLLFQIVFHTSIADCFEEFTISDVLTSICDKMIRRHPHVFSRSSGKQYSQDEWDRIKQLEKGDISVTDSLDRIAKGLPALRYAEKAFRALEKEPSLKREPEEIIATIRMLCESFSRLQGSDETEALLGRILLACSELSYRVGKDAEVLLHQTVSFLIHSYKTSHSPEQGRNRNRTGSESCSISAEGLTFKDLGVY